MSFLTNVVKVLEALGIKNKVFNDKRYVNTTGDLMTGGLGIQPSVDSLTALVVNDEDANNVLTVDTINNRVGIGTTNPLKTLDIGYGHINFTTLNAPSAPTVSLAGNGAGNLSNQNYKYSITFVTSQGETELGTASSIVTVTDNTTDGKVNVTNIPIGNNLVIARKLYRWDSTAYYYRIVTTINDNVTTSYVDNIANSSLSGNAIDISCSSNTTAGKIFIDNTVAMKLGKSDTAFGIGSLANQSSGFMNTGFGTNTLKNVTGNQNTAIGYGAMSDNNGGSYNTALGKSSLKNVTGNWNTATGYNSLKNITSGNSNTAIGMNAGVYYNGTSGDLTFINSSVLIGNGVSPLANIDTNEIVIGINAIGNGSNSATLGNDSVTKTILKGNVGIGTTNPTHKLDVVGSGKFSVNVLTPQIKTDTTAPTDLTITTGDAKTLVLATTVYNDLYTSVASAKVPAVGYPDWTTFTTNTGAYTFKVNDYADLSTIEVLHDYKEGTDLDVHLHLATNGLNDATERKVKYMVYYTWANPDTGSNQFTAESSLTAELTIPANQPDKSSYFLSLGTITGTNIKIGAQIKMRIKRIAGTGTEPINNPFLGMVGMHYEIDTLGSRNISSK